MDKKQKQLDVARASLEAFNTRDWDRFRALLAPNSVYDEVGSGRKLTGRDEIVDVTRRWTQAFSDVKGTISTSIATEDQAVLEVTYEGTHDGELPAPTGPIGPTGSRISTRCVQIFQIEDGLVVNHRNYFDMLAMMQALEAIPTQAARKAGA